METKRINAKSISEIANENYIQGNNEKAKKDLEKLLERFPENYEGNLIKARICLDEKNYENAKKHYEISIKKYQNEEVMAEYAYILKNLGEEYKEIIDNLNKNTQEILIIKGEGYYHNDQYERAILYYEIAEMFGETRAINVKKYTTFFDMGEIEKADKNLKKLL